MRMAAALEVAVVSDFRPEVVRRFELRALFFLASWLENAGRARDFPLHMACIGEPPRSVRLLAERCHASVTIHEPVGADDTGMSNKMRGLEVASRGDSVLLLDSDFLVMSDFSELAGMTGCVAAAPAARNRVPDRYWVRIYPALGLPVPEERMASVLMEVGCPLVEWTEADTRAAASMFPYHNGGAILSPGDSGLRTVWEDHIRRIARLIPADDPETEDIIGSDQTALATSIAQLERQGIPFRRLPDVYNVRNIQFGAAAISPSEAKLYHAGKLGRKLPPGPLAIAGEAQRFALKLQRSFRSYRRPPKAIGPGDENAQAVGDLLSALYLRHVLPALAKPSRRGATLPAGPVVIGGIAGAASGVLRDVLASCPEIHMDQRVRDNGDSRGTRTLDLQRGHIGDEHSGLRRFAESILAQVDPADVRSRRWFGFKDPRMIWHVGTLIERFPAGRFVHLIRDPRTAFPAKALPEGDLDGFLDAWAKTHLPAWRAYADCSRYRLVRYEDLVTSPQRTIRSLFDWLEVGDAAIPGALSLVGTLPQTLKRKNAVDVSRIGAEVAELGYG